jgi:autotransporter translocation and assembly factor TamB
MLRSQAAAVAPALRFLQSRPSTTTHEGNDAMTSTLLPLTLAAAAAAAVPIYEGRVTDPAAPAATLYTYERRVAAGDDGLSASHLTRDAGGALLIDETVRMSNTYALHRFDADNRQQRLRGSATLSADGRRLDFALLRDGVWSHASEAVNDPVVAGPSLHGFMLQHWERLLAGAAIDVRMIVMAKKTTYGFRIRLHSRDAGRTAFSVTPTNWLVRLAVAPLTVAFDSRTRHVLRYDGRVPPLRVVDGRAREFDARVDYTMKAAAYR